MPWSAFNKYPGLSPRWASLTETGHTRWCIAFLKEGACLLTPPTGREKTQEACIWMSPNCLMCLFPLLILLYTREHHWFWVPRELLVISQTWESSWDSRPKAPKPKQTKHTKSKTKDSKQNISEEKRQKTANRSLTSLDCLETWSATLGFCMIFSQMSGSFSSLSFHPVVPPGVKRQQFQSKGIVFYSLITTSFFYYATCHSPFWIKCTIHTYSLPPPIRMRVKGLHHVLLSIITLRVSHLAQEVQLKVLKIHSFNKYFSSIPYGLGVSNNSKWILSNIYLVVLFFHTSKITFRGLKELVQGQTLSQWQWPSIFSPHQASANMVHMSNST